MTTAWLRVGGHRMGVSTSKLDVPNRWVGQETGSQNWKKTWNVTNDWQWLAGKSQTMNESMYLLPKIRCFPAIIMLVFREVKPFASKNSYLLGCPFLIRQTKSQQKVPNIKIQDQLVVLMSRYLQVSTCYLYGFNLWHVATKTTGVEQTGRPFQVLVGDFLDVPGS